MTEHAKPAAYKRAKERVAFDARYVTDRYHGIGRVAFELLTALVGRRPTTEFFIYVHPGYRNTRFDIGALARRPNVTIRPLRLPLIWPTEHLVWPAVLLRDRVELFHSPYIIAPLLTTVPTIVTVHDLILERYPGYTPYRSLRPGYLAMAAMSLRRAAAIITVSDATKHDLATWYRHGAAKVVTIHSGIDSNFGRVTDPAALERVRATYGLPPSFVLAVGAARPHKNLEVIVEAARLLDGSDPMRFVLVSARDARWPDRVGELIRRYRLDDRVTRIGDGVAEADLPALYSLADAFVIPSLVEGFGLPLLEAMAVGCPAIASRTSSLPEVGGDAVRYFNPHSPEDLVTALLRLRDQPEATEELTGRARVRAREFTWDSAAEQASRLYDTLLGRNR